MINQCQIVMSYLALGLNRALLGMQNLSHVVISQGLKDLHQEIIV